MLKRILFAVAVLAVALALAPVSATVRAQGGDTLKYGASASGEITADKLTVSFKFTGKAGDVVLARAEKDDKDDKGNLIPEVFIQDASGKKIADTSQDFTIVAIAVAKLPADGDYTVVVGRLSAEKGDTLGKFIVDLTLATPLADGKAATGTVAGDSDAAKNVSAVFTFDGDNFTVAYARTKGEFAPAVYVYAVTDNGTLNGVANMSGALAGGSLTVAGKKGTYVAVVGNYGQLFSTSFSSSTADFSLTLTAGK